MSWLTVSKHDWYPSYRKLQKATERLKFKALFNGLYQPTEFKTGPGPCGKTLTIHQHHTDGSQKDFEYRLGDIGGRIQYDYELVTVYGEEAERERRLQALRNIPRFIP